METKQVVFRVVSVSQNTNSFGLRGYIMVDQTGRAFEAGKSDSNGNPTYALGDDVTLTETISENNRSLNWAYHGFEIPREKIKMPPTILGEVWGHKWPWNNVNPGNYICEEQGRQTLEVEILDGQGGFKGQKMICYTKGTIPGRLSDLPPLATLRRNFKT